MFIYYSFLCCFIVDSYRMSIYNKCMVFFVIQEMQKIIHVIYKSNIIYHLLMCPHENLLRVIYGYVDNYRNNGYVFLFRNNLGIQLRNCFLFF
jgi:hypothetical protein